VITCGPWCQGPALLEALALAERVGIADLPHNSATYLHRIAECVNLAMADREYFFGDPAFVDVPIDHLLNPATIARRASAVRDDRAFGEMPAPLDRTNLPHAGGTAEMPKVEADTSYCCVVDRWGNAFSATPSDGSGNVPVVPGLGITPSGRGSQSGDPSHPAGVAPGKRPRSRPTGDGGDRGRRGDAAGTPGGDVGPGDVACCSTSFSTGWRCRTRSRRRARRVFVPVVVAPYEYFPGRLALEGD
jgi:gamma-glutamyltranspeptidase/glutathione hydrolase